MSEVVTAGDTTYIIPLDTFDLTYLSKYLLTSNDPVPLWSQQNGKELFKVQIVAQNIDEDDGYIEPLETYTCHICDLEVPNICYNEHNESKTHQTYKKISEKILERVAKQMSIYKTENENYSTKNIYYCSPCSRAIEFKNKYKHEASDYHKMCEENMKILKDFYNKCIQKGKDPDEDTDDENDEAKSDYFEVNDSDDDSDEDVSISDEENDVQDNNYQIEYTQPFNTYLKQVISKYKLRIPVPATENNSIVITPRKGDKILIPRQTFHSYKCVKKIVYCQICKVYINKDVAAHEKTESHVRKIFKNVNENYTRPIDDISGHCLVCNDLILMESDHQRISDDHKINLKTLIYVNKSKDGKTLCRICNVFVDTKDMLVHQNTKIHNERKEMYKMDDKYKEYFCGCCNFDLDVSELINHIDKQNVQDTSNPKAGKYDYCDICEEGVPMCMMKEHFESDSHRDAIIKTFCIGVKQGFKAFIIEFKNSFHRYYMSHKRSAKKKIHTNLPIKTRVLTPIEPIEPIEPKKVVINPMDRYIKLFSFSENTLVTCKICFTKLPQNTDMIIQHVHEKSHHRILNKRYFKLLKYVDSKDTVKCKVCDINLPNTQQDVFEHMESLLHSHEVKEFLEFHEIKALKNTYLCGCCKVNLNDYLDHIHSEYHTGKMQVQFDIDPDLFRRYVYEDSSNGGEATLFRNLYKKLIKSNKIVPLNNSVFYCYKCSIKLPQSSEIDHVLGMTHREWRRRQLNELEKLIA